MGANHFQLSLADRAADIKLAIVTQGQVEPAVAYVTADAAVQAGIRDDPAERSVTPEADGDAVPRVLQQHVGQQQCPGQGAAQRRRCSGGRLMTASGFLSKA